MGKVVHQSVDNDMRKYKDIKSGFDEVVLQTEYIRTKNTDLSGYGRKKKAMVTFVSDDAQIQDYTLLKPIFKSEGVPCVLGVPSGPTISDPAFVQRMTDAQILELQDLGWEIVSHTKTHKSLNTLTESELEIELGQSKQELLNMGFKNVSSSIIYPHGFYNNLVKRVARKYYRSGATTTAGINIQPYNMYQLKRVSLGAYFSGEAGYVRRDTFNDYYKLKVDEALAQNGWLIFVLHPQHADFNATQQGYLTQTIQYIKSLGIPISTMDEALNKTGNILDIEGYSSDDALEKYFRVGSDGSLSSSEIQYPISKIDAQNSHKGDDPVTSYTAKYVTYTFISLPENKVGLPVVSQGLLVTDRTSNFSDWAFQTFYDETKSIYFRSSNGTGAWNAWEKRSKRLLDVSASLDFGAIPAQTTSDKSITVAGAKVGDIVSIVPDSLLENGLICMGHINFDGNVKVRIANVTTASITPAIRNYKVCVSKA